MNEQEQTITELQIQIVGLECRINQNPAGQELRNELKTLRFQKNNLYLKWLVGEYNTSRQSYVGLKFQNTEPNPELKQVKGEDESSLSNLIERLNVLSHNISNTQLSIKKAEENISNPELTTRELSERLLTSQGILNSYGRASQKVLPPARQTIPPMVFEEPSNPLDFVIESEFNSNSPTFFDLRKLRHLPKATASLIISQLRKSIAEGLQSVGETFASSSMKSVRTSRLTSSNIASVRIPRQSTGVIWDQYTTTALDIDTTGAYYLKNAESIRSKAITEAEKANQ